MGIKKVKVEYCGDNYELFCSTNDDRTNLVSGRKGTQEGKVCTWKEIVTKLKSQRVFDVGSNYGEFLIPISHMERDIYSFEPVKDVYSCLTKTVDSLPFDTSHINVINSAIGDSTKHSVLHIPSSSGNASLDINNVAHKNTVRTENVEQHDVLHYLKDCDNFVMKIDIEGLEYKVLRRIMENDTFDWFCIMFEFNRFSKSRNDVIEEFLDGKQVTGIANHKIELKNENFISYEKGKSFDFIKHAHDVIVCKNVDWS